MSVQCWVLCGFRSESEELEELLDELLDELELLEIPICVESMLLRGAAALFWVVGFLGKRRLGEECTPKEAKDDMLLVVVEVVEEVYGSNMSVCGEK